jgi:hypothetical protein
MLLKPKGSTNPHDQFHVPFGIGKALCLTGVVEEVSVAPKFDPMFVKPTRWRVVQFDLDLSSQAPMLAWSCECCNQSGQQESIRGTAAETARFQHCGGVEQCPADVAAQYERAWGAYEAARRKPKPNKEANSGKVFFVNNR